MKVTPNQLIADFKESLDLLSKSGPNPLLTNQDEFWDRYNKLMDKYVPSEEEENEDD